MIRRPLAADVSRVKNMTKVQLINELRQMHAFAGEIADRAVRAEAAKANYPGQIAELDRLVTELTDELVDVKAALAAAIAGLDGAMKDLSAAKASRDKWQQLYEQARTGNMGVGR